MAYITYAQYEALFGTPPINEAEFGLYATTASDLVDSVTQYRIVEGGGIASLPAAVQSRVQKATAAQVLYFIQSGGMETVLSGQTGQGFTVGKVHIDGAASGQGVRTAAQMTISPMVRVYLEQTGLMGRNVVCSGRYRGLY